MAINDLRYDKEFYERIIKDKVLPDELVKSVIAKGDIYIVGGAVRDLIHSGSLPKEIDFLLVGWHASEVLWKLNKYGSAVFVGHSFGVIKFTYNGITSDISVPEIRGSDCGINDDLQNRDYTINAIAMRLPDMEIVDPYNGIADLKAKVIREVTGISMFHDPIRSLRGIRFATQFGFAIEEQTSSHIKTSVAMLDSVAPERIRDELCKMLTELEKPSSALFQMQKLGIIRQILPALENCINVGQEGGWHIHDVFRHTVLAIDNAPRNLVLRLSLLLHDIGKPACRFIDPETGRAHFKGHDNVSVELAKKVLKELRFSNDIIEDVLVIVGNHMTQIPETIKGKKRLIRKLGEERVQLFIQHRVADLKAMDIERVQDEITANESLGRELKEIIDSKTPIQLADLDINGDILIDSFGLDEGPKIGMILEHLLDLVLDDTSLNTQDKLMELTKSYLSNNP